MFLHISEEKLIEEGVDNGYSTEAKMLQGLKYSLAVLDLISHYCKKQQR